MVVKALALPRTDATRDAKIRKAVLNATKMRKISQLSKRLLDAAKK
jgi:hypothetical protein